MKQLYQITKDNLNPERISIDTLSESDCRETFLELGLSTEHLHTLPTPDAIPKSDWVQFHETLYLKGISIVTYNQLIYVQNNLDKQSLSAADVAEWLNMSYRSANRILLGLERCGLIEEEN